MAITIKDVASKAGVDPATVSRVLNKKAGVKKETAQKVLDAAKELGYRINPLASSLKGGPSYTIGIVVPLIISPRNMQLIDGIASILEPKGYTLLITKTDNDPEKEKKDIEQLIARRVDAIIGVFSHPDCKYLLDYVHEGIPIIMLERYIKDLPIDTVCEDWETVSYEIVNKLTSKGHKNIAFMYEREDIAVSRYSRLGYEKAMREANAPIDPANIIETGVNYQVAYDKTVEIMKGENAPTAIFSINSFVATAVLAALREMGMNVPEYVSFASGSQIYGHRLVSPKIVSSVPHYQELGNLAAKLVLKRIEQKKARQFPDEYAPEKIFFPSEYVDGNSIAAPRK